MSARFDAANIANNITVNTNPAAALIPTGRPAFSFGGRYRFAETASLDEITSTDCCFAELRGPGTALYFRLWTGNFWAGTPRWTMNSLIIRPDLDPPYVIRSPHWTTVLIIAQAGWSTVTGYHAVPGFPVLSYTWDSSALSDSIAVERLTVGYSSRSATAPVNHTHIEDVIVRNSALSDADRDDYLHQRAAISTIDSGNVAINYAMSDSLSTVTSSAPVDVTVNGTVTLDTAVKTESNGGARPADLPFFLLEAGDSYSGTGDDTLHLSASTPTEADTWTVDWKALQGAGFSAGDEVVIWGPSGFYGHYSADPLRIAVRKGATFAGATELADTVCQTEQTGLHQQDTHGPFWLAKFTLAADDNIYFAMNGVGSSENVGLSGRVFLMKFDSNFMQWAQNDTAATSTEWEQGAALTLQPNEAGYLLIGGAVFAADSVVGRGNYRIAARGGELVGSCVEEAEDTDDVLHWTVSTYVNPGSPEVYRVDTKVDEAGDGTFPRSSLWAINLDAFEDVTTNYARMSHVPDAADKYLRGVPVPAMPAGVGIALAVPTFGVRNIPVNATIGCVEYADVSTHFFHRPWNYNPNWKACGEAAARQQMEPLLFPCSANFSAVPYLSTDAKTATTAEIDEVSEVAFTLRLDSVYTPPAVVTPRVFNFGG